MEIKEGKEGNLLVSEVPVGFVLALLVQEAAEVTKVGNEFHISPRTERLISEKDRSILECRPMDPCHSHRQAGL